MRRPQLLLRRPMRRRGLHRHIDGEHRQQAVGTNIRVRQAVGGAMTHPGPSKRAKLPRNGLGRPTSGTDSARCEGTYLSTCQFIINPARSPLMQDGFATHRAIRYPSPCHAVLFLAQVISFPSTVAILCLVRQCASRRHQPAIVRCRVIARPSRTAPDTVGCWQAEAPIKAVEGWCGTRIVGDGGGKVREPPVGLVGGGGLQ